MYPLCTAVPPAHPPHRAPSQLSVYAVILVSSLLRLRLHTSSSPDHRAVLSTLLRTALCDSGGRSYRASRAAHHCSRCGACQQRAQRQQDPVCRQCSVSAACRHESTAKPAAASRAERCQDERGSPVSLCAYHATDRGPRSWPLESLHTLASHTMANRPPALLDADRFGFSGPTSPDPSAPRRVMLSPGSKVSNLTASLLLAPPGAAVDERGSRRAQMALQAQQQRMLEATGGQNAGWIGERVEHFDPLSLAMSRPGAHRLPGFESLSSGFLRPSLNPYAANHSAHLLEEDQQQDDLAAEGVNLWQTTAEAAPAPIFDEKEMIEQVWDYRSDQQAEDTPRTAARTATRRRREDREVVEQSHQRVASLIQAAAASSSSSAFKFSRASVAASSPAAAGPADVAAQSHYALSVDQPPPSATQPLPSAASTQASGPFANMFNVLPVPDGSHAGLATPSASAASNATSPAARSEESQQLQVTMTPMASATTAVAGGSGTTPSPSVLSPLVSPGGVGLPSPAQSDIRSPAPSTQRSDPPSSSRSGGTNGERTAESIFADSHEVDPNYLLLPMSTLRHVVPGYAHLHPRIAVLSPGLGLRSIQAQNTQSAKDARDTKTKRETGPLPSTDPYYETIVAKRASKIGRALALFQSGAFKQSPRVEEEEQPEDDPASNIPVMSEADLAAAAAEALEQKQRQAKLAADIELDRLKVIAHEQYMRLVIRHVRTRLIQEQRFICTTAKGTGSAPSSPPQHSNSISAQQTQPSPSEYEAQVAIRRRDRWGVGGQATAAPTAAGTTVPSAMTSRATSATPVRLRDINYEVTGIRSPIPDPDFEPAATAADFQSPKGTAGKGNQRAPSTTGGKKSGGSASLLSPKGVVAAAVAATSSPLPAGSFDPLANISFHIDPLDPSRPENVGKIYRMNPAYISQKHTFPLWSRGPTHSWQVLLDEEEVSCYRKVLWMCEIQALSHVPLDGMLELILSMVERAFDVEVILRAGDPGSSLFLIKHGEVQLKMDRSIVEQMEESHMLAEQREIEAKALTGAAASLLINHPHPDVPAAGVASDASILSSASAPLAPGRPAPLSLLTTDPELQTKFVEIAKLGAMGLFGEDILLAPHRRYTVLSLTPVWAYEIKAVDLLKAFDASARASLCEAVAHTQRVRERHALVKNRTRLQHHAAPTLFRHFLDDGLQRNLRRHATVESRNKDVQRVSLGEMQGSPDALRAVLHDLDHIQSKQRYNRKSPQNIEALVRKGSISARHAQEHLAAQKKAAQKGGNAASPQTKSTTALFPAIGSPSNSQVKAQRPGSKATQEESKEDGAASTEADDAEDDQFTGRPPALSITFDSPSASPPAILSPDECDPVSPTSPNGTKIGWRSLKHSLLSPDAPLHQLVRQGSLERIKESKGLAGLALNALEVARTPAGAGWATDASTPMSSVSASGSGSVTPSMLPRERVGRNRTSSRDVSPDPRPGGGGTNSHATLYDPSPFSLQFREGSVLEKSGIGLSAPSRGGAVGLHVSYNKTHVARGNVAPMRAQHGSMVMLGYEDQGLRSFGSQGDEYARPEPAFAGAVHAPSVRKRGTSVGDAGALMAGSGGKSIKSPVGATSSAASAAATPSSKSPPTKLRSSASLPALQSAATASAPATASATPAVLSPVAAASTAKSPPATYALRSSASVKRLPTPMSSSVKHSPSHNKGTLAAAVMRK